MANNSCSDGIVTPFRHGRSQFESPRGRTIVSLIVMMLHLTKGIVTTLRKANNKKLNNNTNDNEGTHVYISVTH